MVFSFTTIADYHRQLQQGQITCEAAVLHYLQSIRQQPQLNAMVHLFADEALQTARQLDQRLAAGDPLLPLHGVVVTLKDVFCYAGHPVSAASRMLNGFNALFSATAVQRLLDAGAIIIGTTNCDEFAMGSTNETSAYGPVLNAADHSRVPGGSSGGSAVAVQAGLCMCSLGSDTGGSVRQPADFCGIVGLKPGYGRISRHGLIAYASSFDCVGIFGLTVTDVARVYNVIAGPDGFDSTALQMPAPEVEIPVATKQPPWRFAWLEPTLSGSIDPEIRAALQGCFEHLAAAGHTVEAVPFPLLDYIVPAYYVLTTAEASSNLSRYDGIRYGHASEGSPADLTAFYQRNRSEGFGREVKRRIMLGTFVLSAGYYDAYFTKAQQVRKRIIDETARIFRDFDAILMPVSPGTAPKLGEQLADPVAMYLADIYTVFANLAGIPAMAVPLFRHSNGLPFGLQVLTNRGNEVPLHRISAYLEAMRPG